jgi:hypothetical protein
MSWNMPVHRGREHDERAARGLAADARDAAQNARTARTVAQHATDAQDCRILLEMLGLRLDGLRSEKPS